MVTHPFEKFRRDHKPPMSKADLGRMLGVSRSHIHRIEMGERQVGMVLLAKAIQKTGVSARALRPDMGRLLKR